MTAKEILLKVKAFFDEPVVTPAAASVATPFKLKDGTEISIALKDPTVSMIPETGDIVTANGAPAADGDYELEDGTKITVAAGAITVVVPVAPVTQTAEEMAAAAEAARIAALAQPTVLTAEAVQAMYAKFATGTPEERIANLETMVKALMDCNFGYELRKGQEAAAIQVYKDSLAPIQTTIATQTSQLQAAEQKITKQDEVIKGLFELAEELVKEPSADPVTLTGSKKDKFDRINAKEERLNKYAEAIKKNKEKALA